MATDTTKTYDEVHFALYFDRELDQAAEALFEEALDADAQLLAQYNEWVDTYEALNAHFESLESSYPLEGFTDRVMGELPELTARTQASAEPTGESARAESAELAGSTSAGVSWIRQMLVPFLIGSLAAAALFIAISRQASSPSDGGSSGSNAELNNPTDGLTPISDEKSGAWTENDDEEDEDDEGGI